MYFSEEVVLLHEPADDRDSALLRLANELLRKGLVATSFPQAVLDREEKYPTGLNLGRVGVAIPHTDVEHVIRPQLGFMSLAHPVRFRQMGDESAVTDVSLIIMLGLHKSEDQVPMLQKLMGLIQDEASVQRLQEASSKDDVIEVFTTAGVV